MAATPIHIRPPVDSLASGPWSSSPDVHVMHMGNVAGNINDVAALHISQAGLASMSSVAGMHAIGSLPPPPVHGLGVVASLTPDVHAISVNGVRPPLPSVNALHVIVEPEAAPVYAHLERLPSQPVYAHLERLPGPTLSVQGHHGGIVSQRTISADNQERFTQAYADLQGIVAAGLGVPTPLANFTINLHDLTVTYGNPPSTVTLQSLLPRLNADQISALEKCTDTLRDVAVKSGVLGSWRVGLHDKVRGATGAQGHGLEQRSGHIRSLPHLDVEAFAENGWLDKLVNESSHLPPVAGAAVLSPADHKKKVMKRIIKAEAGHRIALKKLREERVRLEAECAAHPGDAIKQERLKQLRELVMRLDKEYDAFAYHWAVVYGAEGDAVERAGILKDTLERVVSQNFKVEDADRERWFEEQDGEKVADYLREAAALPIEDRDAYIHYCHKHKKGPLGVNSTGFMVHVMKAMEDPTNPLPLEFARYGVNLDGDAEVLKIFKDAFSEAHNLAEAYERDMTAPAFLDATPGKQMGILLHNPHYAALIRPPAPKEEISWGKWAKNIFWK